MNLVMQAQIQHAEKMNQNYQTDLSPILNSQPTKTITTQVSTTPTVQHITPQIISKVETPAVPQTSSMKLDLNNIVQVSLK
jgi:hypothetical protein